jgi:hypothetical protein
VPTRRSIGSATQAENASWILGTPEGTIDGVQWLLDNPGAMLCLGVVFFAILATAAHRLLGHLRAGRTSWPRGWRWLCRMGQHTLAGRHPHPESATDPCRYEWQCTSCGRLASAGPVHDYGPAGEKDAACVRTAACRRCGGERRDADHRIRAVLGDDLTMEDRNRIPTWSRVEICDVVEICDDCDHWHISDFQRHDPASTDFDNRCRRCGHWDDIDD